MKRERFCSEKHFFKGMRRRRNLRKSILKRQSEVRKKKEKQTENAKHRKSKYLTLWPEAAELQVSFESISFTCQSSVYIQCN